ncbi:AAA family ATPase [Haloimpatiens sp. FM7315]|uniref:AAA family ATPase n=1 Tax=Haloimpatiens sp. FM7315 TaxID=3298609 RepID=UPI00370B839B
MKPILLKIKGLNSFCNAQTIDFSKLIEKGFFGIFGPTGSGKSTILDAITVALYGKVTRDTKGFINTDSDSLEVSYEFSIGSLKRRIYVCERCIKVDKNGGYKTTMARIYEKLDTSKVEILAEGASNVKNSVEDIIGLSCEDFTRSVVLPQGKFSEFLSLTGLQRRNMLERIFKLEKFGMGLRDRIKKYKDKREKLIIELNGKLSRYGDVSEDKVKEVKEDLKTFEKRVSDLKKNKEDILEKYDKYKMLWDIKEELEKFIDSYNKLITDEGRINEARMRLNYSKNANQIKPLIDEKKSTEKNINKIERDLKDRSEEIKGLNLKLAKLEKDYDVALKDQKENIPKLIRKSTELNQAIEIKCEIESLKKEKEELAKKYREILLNTKKIDDQLKSIDIEEIELKDNLLKIEKEISLKSISPEYRALISDAHNKYLKYIELEKNAVNIDTKYSEATKKLKYNKVEFEKLKKLKLESESKLEELINIKKDHFENCPGDKEVLLGFQEKRNNALKKYEEILKDLENKNELMKKKLEIAEEKSEIQNKVEKLNLNYENEKNKLIDLNKVIEEKQNENMAAILSKALEEGKPCPVCGAVHHIKMTRCKEDNFLIKLKAEKEEEEKEIEGLKKDIEKYNIKLTLITSDEKYCLNELTVLNDRIKDETLESILKDKNAIERDFCNLKESIDLWDKRAKNIEEELEKVRAKKENSDKLYITMHEKISNEEVNLNNLQKELNNIREELQKAFNEYNVLVKDLVIENILDEDEKIKKWDVDTNRLRNLEKGFRNKKDEIHALKEELQRKLSSLGSAKAKIEQSGKEKKDIIEGFIVKLKAICGIENPRDMLKITNKNINDINELEDYLKKALENMKDKKDMIEKEINSLQKNLEMLHGILKDQNLKVSFKLKEYSFKSEEEVFRYIITEKDMDELEKDINYFDETKKTLETNINRLKGKISEDKISKEDWTQIREEKDNIEEELNKSIEIMAQKRKELKDFQRDLEESLGLLKLKKEYEHIYSLCEEIDNLVKGNKFVEFVAMNELKYIALEASKRLKNITRGRYALEIDEDGNFIMRDDFNGGRRRPTSTLSGGETFLTSLSLALALSSKIQLKGSAPLEFFFLDEGFGSLDSELLDVVMTSLENLREENLCVGIISHVEELKNRVPIKLIVTPYNLENNGSKVDIEYS